jgi:hypothetical protein
MSSNQPNTHPGKRKTSMVKPARPPLPMQKLHLLRRRRRRRRFLNSVYT